MSSDLRGLGPERPGEPPPIPVRMVNEFVYCPRLAWLEWVAGEWADSADTVDGRIRHRRVDRSGGNLPAEPNEAAVIHARSVLLASDALGIIAKLDLVEGEGVRVTPVDYKRQTEAVRPLYVADSPALPLHVQSPRAWLRKDGDCIVVEAEREKIAEARLADVSQVVVYGGGGMSTPLLHELMGRGIPVTWLSYGGWLMGHTVGAGHHNVDVRTHQYRASFDAERCRTLARGLVAAKIRNCRTLVRRNWREGGGGAPPQLLVALKDDARHAERASSIESLLGTEGSAAARYFANFGKLLKADALDTFVFAERNRRPPRDPVNALLSFAYSMLVREWLVVLSAVGLDAYRGFYHQQRFARPALALDMMEPFRPLIADSVVITAINNGEVNNDDFVRAAGGCALSDRGRRAVTGNSPASFPTPADYAKVSAADCWRSVPSTTAA